MIKYLYILTSDETDYYTEQALMSITSLKMRMPDTFVSLLIDDVTEKTLTGKRGTILESVNELKIAEVDPQFNRKARSRWLKTSMRRHIKGDFLYIDCDTVICEDLSDIEKTTIDLGAVLDEHILLRECSIRKNVQSSEMFNFNFTFLDNYYNSGVIFCKDISICHSFFEEWHKLWLNNISKGIIDQPSFNQANKNFDGIIKEMDGIWNCQIPLGGLVFLVNSKIIHYISTIKNNNPYTMADPSLLKKIKEYGIDNDVIEKYLLHPKTNFYFHTRMITNKKTLEAMFSLQFQILKRIYNWKCIQLIEKCLQVIYNAMRKNKK